MVRGSTIMKTYRNHINTTKPKKQIIMNMIMDIMNIERKKIKEPLCEYFTKVNYAYVFYENGLLTYDH